MPRAAADHLTAQQYARLKAAGAHLWECWAVGKKT